MSDRRDGKERRTQGERKDSVNKRKKQMIEALRMQARTRCAANRVMRVEPTDEKKTIEWQAADLLEGKY